MSHIIQKNRRSNFFGPPSPTPSPNWKNHSIKAHAEIPLDILKTNVGPTIWGGRGETGAPDPPPTDYVFRGWISYAERPELPPFSGFINGVRNPGDPVDPPVPYRWIDRQRSSFSVIPDAMLTRNSSQFIPPPTKTGLGPELETLQTMIFDSIGIEPAYKKTTTRIVPTYKAKGGIEN